MRWPHLLHCYMAQPAALGWFWMLYLQHPTMQLDLPYPLVVTKSLLLKPFCHLEIVDLPIKHAGSFHSFLGLFARGSVDVSRVFWYRENPSEWRFWLDIWLDHMAGWWWLSHLPLWKIWVCQLGWWNSHIYIYYRKVIKFHGSKPPTRDLISDITTFDFWWSKSIESHDMRCLEQAWLGIDLMPSVHFIHNNISLSKIGDTSNYQSNKINHNYQPSG